MSTRTASIPDSLTEPVFVVGLVLGAALLGLGLGTFILGVSVGVRGEVLPQSQQTVLMAGGAVVAVVGFAIRWWRNDAPRDHLEVGAVAAGAVGAIVGLALVAFGVAGLLDLGAPTILETLKLSPNAVLQATWLAAAVVAAGVAVAAVAGYVAVRRTALTPADLRLSVWAVGTVVVVAGLTALFIGYSTHDGVSAPFFETMRDKALMIAFGQLLMLTGWSSIRLSGRTVGW